MEATCAPQLTPAAGVIAAPRAVAVEHTKPEAKPSVMYIHLPPGFRPPWSTPTSANHHSNSAGDGVAPSVSHARTKTCWVSPPRYTTSVGNATWSNESLASLATSFRNCKHGGWWL